VVAVHKVAGSIPAGRANFLFNIQKFRGCFLKFSQKKVAFKPGKSAEVPALET
jgi:hypothetical protein